MNVPGMEWRELAACRYVDPALFYVGRGEPISEQVIDACENCPVHGECYDHALRHEEFGYWAGTSAIERQRLRKRTGIRFEGFPLQIAQPIQAGHGTAAGYMRHRRAVEEPCDLCRKAHANANRKRWPA